MDSHWKLAYWAGVAIFAVIVGLMLASTQPVSVADKTIIAEAPAPPPPPPPLPPPPPPREQPTPWLKVESVSLALSQLAPTPSFPEPPVEMPEEAPSVEIRFADPAPETAAAPAAIAEPSPLPTEKAPKADPPKPPAKKKAKADASPVEAHEEPAALVTDSADPFYGQRELSVDALVAEVEQRNPSLQAATAAWRAAAQRYPQAISLDDPMFEFMIAPAAVEGDEGYILQLSQEIPWCGKREFRGAVAAAEAEMRQGEIGETRLRLAEAARRAFFDYYQAARILEVNAKTIALMKEFRDIARGRYEVNQATEQDVLQAELELAELQNRRADAVRDRQVTAARINTLLHREPTCPLPPPPEELSLPDSFPPGEVLQDMAVEARPDLFAQGAQIRAEEARLGLACKEYYPDLTLIARYDGMMMEEEMRPMVGVAMNIPIRQDRRRAAVCEATWRIQQQRAEYLRRVDEVRFEVQAARERLTQGGKIVRFFTERILPTAEESLESARSNYETGRIDFLRLLDAERQYYSQRERYYQAIADYFRRLAELERAVGAALPLASAPSAKQETEPK